MQRKEGRLAPWNGVDLEALLALEGVGPLHYRTRHGDPNENGRSYGGQLLAHAMLAASASVPADRPATAMQLLFLQGALHDLPLDLRVSVLQEGKRFSSRHVRGTQGEGRTVLDAHLTFAVPSAGPSHAAATSAREAPASQPRLRDLPADCGRRLHALGPYNMEEKACLDFRLVDGARTLATSDEPRARFWLRARMNAESARLHEGAFAYMSDWWLNYSSLGSHAGELTDAGRRIYIASLNHSIWFHRPFRADRWLHFDTESANAAVGRGLSLARIHDESGLLVATASQECLMAYAEDPSA